MGIALGSTTTDTNVETTEEMLILLAFRERNGDRKYKLLSILAFNAMHV